ncbi:MAG: hypothetical protein AB1585_13095 [Thermodesulfobacteriota bacterium]
MPAELKADNTELKSQSSKTLTIEIEPSYPLISAMAQFFRDQKKPRQFLELCRLGLNFFPGDKGLRLKSALAYLDLQETEKAWAEIKSVAAELNRLAADLDLISKHPRLTEEGDLARWLFQLAQILSNGPGEKPDNPTVRNPPSTFLRRETVPGNTGAEGSAPQSNTGSQASKVFPQPPPEEAAKRTAEPVPDGGEENNILSTLNGWLTQLKGSRA